MTWIGTYILNEAGEPQPERDTLAWGQWFENANRKRRVAVDDLGELGCVSTVLLGRDHSWGIIRAEDDPLNYRPTLWETMVFGGPLDREQQRYQSKAEAVAGHRALVEKLKAAGM